MLPGAEGDTPGLTAGHRYGGGCHERQRQKLAQHALVAYRGDGHEVTVALVLLALVALRLLCM